MDRRAALRALVAGCGAGLVLTATMLVLRLRLAAPSFPERVGDSVLLLIPQPLFEAALERLRFSAKPLLFVAIVAAQLLVATAGGVVYARAAIALAARLDLTNPLIGGAAGLLLGVAIDIAFLPAVGAAPTIAARDWPAAASALALAALPGLAYGLSLATLLRLASPPRATRHPLTGGMVVPRGRVTRRFVVGLLLPAVGALVTAASLRRIVGGMRPQQPARAAQAFASPTPSALPLAPSATATAPHIAATPPAPTPPPPSAAAPPTSAAAARPAGQRATRVAPPTISAPPPPTVPPTPAPTPTPSGPTIPAGVAPLITPTDRFYLVSKNFVDPAIKATTWQLAIGGLVEEPRTLRYADLLLSPSTSRPVTLECISNEIGGDLMGAAVWTGVSLRTLLAGAAVRPEATHLIFTCADDYVEWLPLDVALDPATLLAYAMNGEPLPDAHGFPARLIVPGHYGMKNPKWVVTIEAASRAGTGYWARRGWAPDAPVETIARIDVPAPDQFLPQRPTLVGGIAFAGDRGIARVELSTDGGASWQAADLEPPLSSLTWVRWAARWEPPAAGEYALVARAYAADGTPQVAMARKSGPAGATGYATRQVTVGP